MGRNPSAAMPTMQLPGTLECLRHAAHRPPSSPFFLANMAGLAENLVLQDSEQKLYVVPLYTAWCLFMCPFATPVAKPWS